MPQLISGQRTINYPDLFERARRAASGLISLGIGADDTVALLLRNDFAIFEASYAAMMIGALPTPINWHSAPPEFQYVLENSSARVLVAHADLFEPVRDRIPSHVRVFLVPTPKEVCTAYAVNPSSVSVPNGATAWDSWISQFEPRPGNFNTSRASMIYTSGTTGNPKGVRRFPLNAEQAIAIRAVRSYAWGFENCEPNKVVSVMTGPMYHSATITYGLMISQLGGELTLQPKFDAEELLAIIEERKVTHLHMVPVMFNRLLALPAKVRERYDLRSIKCVGHGAAPVSIAAKRAMIDWWGPVFSEYYGGTEVGTVTCCKTEEWSSRPGTVGRTVPGARISILDPDGRALPRGEVGEVAARLDTISDFTYHGDEAKRAQASRPNGLISIGDIGYLDEEGFLFLCDRSADIVISGGVNIYTAEVEGALVGLEGIADCAVIGIPDDEFGEKLCALIQRLPGSRLTPSQIEDYLRGKIAAYKIPRQIEFRETLCREESGKIFKRRLREEFWQGRDRRIA